MIELPPKLEDGLGYLVHHLMYALRRNFIRASDRAGMRITPDEMIVLVLVGQWEGLMQTELANMMVKDKAVITRMLSGLQERGLVRREADVNDRRAVRTYLTEQGREAVEALQPLLESFMRQSLGGVSQQDFDTTLKTMRAIIENLQAME